MSVGKSARFAITVICFAGLASCQKPLVLLVGPEVQDLQPLVQKALAANPSAGHWTLQPDTKPWPGAALALRLTTTPGWNLPSSTAPAVQVSDEWRKGGNYRPPDSLARMAMNGQNWEAIPLFYDVWGETRFVPQGSKASSPTDWDRLLAQAGTRSLVMAGSRPAFRQWAFVGAVSDGKAHALASPWFALASKPWEGELSALASLKDKACWAANSWDFKMADLLQAYKPNASSTFLETFRDYETANVQGSRRFDALRIPGPSGFALGGIVVFAELRGAPGRWKAALPLLRILTGSAFQREIGSRTYWLAANSGAPELDGTGAAVRNLVRQAEFFYPLTDRLPDPLVENNLTVDVQLAIDEAPKK